MTGISDEWMSVGEVAEMIGMSVQAVRNYCGMNGYPARLVFVRTPGGHRRIARHSAEALAKAIYGEPAEGER